MKKIILSTLFIIFIFISAILLNGHAQAQGGTGGSGGGGNGPTGGTSNVIHDCGQSEKRNAFVVEMVYYDGKRIESLGSVVVMLSGSPASSYQKAVRDYANNHTTTQKILTSGPFYTLAECSNDKHCTYEQLEQQGWFDKNLPAEVAIDILNIPQSKMTRQHEKPYGINKKGYRIMVQRLAAWCQNRTVTRAYPRKAAAAEGWRTVNGEGDFLGKGRPSDSQDDLWTLRHDIGIKAGSDYEWSKANFADYSIGVGYNIAWFPNKYANRDYSIDAACENCDENNKNGSYFIQDTTDWEGILDSPNVNGDNQNAKTYFKKKVGGCEVFCREEYRITYPNENDKISVESGRFFTVNKLGGSMYATGIPNFKQIKITKVRECRVNSGNQKSCLTSFANTAKTRTTKADKTGSAAGDVGTIKLTYKENYKDSKYNKDEYKNIELKENKNRTIIKDEYINSTVNSSNVMLKSTVTKYFELPEETFRWINIRDGVSSFKKPTEGLEHYLDVETSNLPVSINNTTKEKGETAGTVTLNYSLPSNTDDPYTLIKKAFNAKNDYFLDPKSKPDENIYSKAKKGYNALDERDKKQIQESACAKLFGFGTAKYNSCVNARTSNKAGNCYNQVVKPNNYVCNLGLCPEEGCLSCRIEGGTYYGKDGKEVSESEYAKQCGCRIIDGKYYGQRGNEITKEEYLVECPQICRIENGKYYGKKGQIVSKKQYEAECPDKCMLCNGGECCPDLDMVCPDMNGECPGKGRIIIYRPIDLQNPFPGQTNYDRATGNNWCAYNVKTGKMNCKSTNGVATTHIQNNRSTEDESVYEKTPLYEVDLDPTIMKSIRKYNKTNKYDDFNLNCNTKLKEPNATNSSDTVCYSTFLRESKTGLKITGACSSLGSLSTCAESRG